MKSDDGPPLSNSFGTRVRTAGGAAPAGGPASPSTVLAAPVVAAYVPPAPGTTVTYEQLEDRYTGTPDRTAGRPRTQGRPQPEYPREGYGAYRLLGRRPAGTSRWTRLADWVLGHPSRLLYIGISCRAGFVRWVEHSDTKTWAADVTECEIIPRERWDTLNDTVLDDQTGRPWLVFDVTATADDGIRPIKPGEAVEPDPHFREVHAEMVEVYYLDERGTVPAGIIAEGARTGEKRLIQAWDGGPRPIHNIEHNEGSHAVNRVARRFPRLVALARRQALALALGWLVLGVAVGLLPGAGWWIAVLAAAALLQAVQIMRLVLTGFPGPRRRKPRRPRGRKRHQRRRKR